MGRAKLQKFSEMRGFRNVIQPSFREVFGRDHHYKGHWRDFFGNGNPIILELGCGKGEYTTGMAGKDPGSNHIGVDIKGARIWTGAREALSSGLRNVAFIRARIEFIGSFFDREEIREIWLTFPDPQTKKRRNKKRLTGAGFLNLYRRFLVDNGLVHLKTDDAGLFGYSRDLVRFNDLEIVHSTDDLYARDQLNEILYLRTFYEKKFLQEGRKIHYLSFRLADKEIAELPG